MEKEEAMRLCKIFYIEKEILLAIHDNIKVRNLTVYFDGFQIRTNCYYKEFMDRDYYDIHHVINSTECCSIWDDYRVACRWNCDLQPGQYYSIADYNDSDKWYREKINETANEKAEWKIQFVVPTTIHPSLCDRCLNNWTGECSSRCNCTRWETMNPEHRITAVSRNGTASYVDECPEGSLEVSGYGIFGIDPEVYFNGKWTYLCHEMPYCEDGEEWYLRLCMPKDQRCISAVAIKS